MTTSFLIRLDSKSDVFFADSEVNGKIFLNTTEADTVRKINVTIIGRAHVYFEEIYYAGDGGIIVIPYELEEYYINNVNECLWEWNESNQLTNDEHWFPFKFKIPSNAPANASERYGHVQYYVKAEVEYYNKKRFLIKNHTEKEYYGFSVCPIIDLNLRPELKLPAQTFSTQTKRRNCFSCAKKMLMVTTSLPKTGFVCGEVIPLKIDISNKTSMKIKSLEYGISLKCLFTGKIEYTLPCSTEIISTDTKEKNETVDVVNYVVKPTSNSEIYSILIPPLSPTFCTFLKIEYSVFVKVHTNAICRSGPSTLIPIFIGTVPLKKEEEGNENKDTVSAMEIFKTADLIEGSARCEIYKYKRKGPTEYIPKFAYYSNLSSLEKLSSH